MALFDDVFKGGNIITGLAVGIGTAVLLPAVVPAVSTLLRPAAKAAIKGGILAYDRGRQAMAQMSEMASDMVAEARADAQHTEAATAEPAAGDTQAA